MRASSRYNQLVIIMSKPITAGYSLNRITRNRWVGIYPLNGDTFEITRHNFPNTHWQVRCPNVPPYRYQRLWDALRAINAYIPHNIVFYDTHPTGTSPANAKRFISRYHPDQSILDPPTFTIEVNLNGTFTLYIRPRHSKRRLRIFAYYALQDCMQIAQYLYDTDRPVPLNPSPQQAAALKDAAYQHPVKANPSFTLRVDLPYSAGMAKNNFGRFTRTRYRIRHAPAPDQ
jgi:hypothetical protein